MTWPEKEEGLGYEIDATLYIEINKEEDGYIFIWPGMDPDAKMIFSHGPRRMPIELLQDNFTKKSSTTDKDLSIIANYNIRHSRRKGYTG